MPSAFSIHIAEWRHDQAAIALLRRTVFIDEQGVPEALEWEADDADYTWFVARAAGDPAPTVETIGIARLAASGKIGRMAVVPGWRRQGVGSALLDAAIEAARRHGLTDVYLSAQVHAMPFYARRGFQAVGPEYVDAGIPHRDMKLNLRELP